jgi:hypothetical protein
VWRISSKGSKMEAEAIVVTPGERFKEKRWYKIAPHLCSNVRITVIKCTIALSKQEK